MADEKIKKPCSEKQRLANIANAKLSSGPVTDAGKNICKWNGLQHGLRSAHDVIPGESQEQYAARMAAWMEHWEADSDLVSHLVERAVKSSWLVARAERANEAQVIKNMKAAGKAAGEQQADEIERLAAELAASPGRTIRRLRTMPAGIRWIGERWLVIGNRIKQYRNLLDSQRALAISLLGKQMQDVFRDDPLVTRWLIAMLGTFYGDQEAGPGMIAMVAEDLGGRPAGMTAVEFEHRIEKLIAAIPGVHKGRADLAGYIAEVLKELESHLARVTEEADHDRMLDVTIAGVDTASTGKNLLTYVAIYSRSRDLAMNRLDKLKAAPRPRRGRGQGPGPDHDHDPNHVDGGSPAETELEATTTQPGIADTTDAEADIAAETELAAATEATATEPEPLVETTTEVPPATEPAPEPEIPTTRPIFDFEPTIEPMPEFEIPTTRPISSVEPPTAGLPISPSELAAAAFARVRSQNASGRGQPLSEFIADGLREWRNMVLDACDELERQGNLGTAPAPAAGGGRDPASGRPGDGAQADAVRAPPP